MKLWLVNLVWLVLSLPVLAQGARPAESGALDPDEVARAVENYLATIDAERSAQPRKSWERILDRLTMYGDLRLRHESSFSLPGAPDRRRERLRLRVGANYSLNEELLLGTRIVTGDPTDPNSSQITLGDGFDKLEFNLDRAFATWRPKCAPGLWVTAGKFAHAFQANAVYSELVWDGDVQPEGIFAGWRFEEVGPLENLTVRGGEYLLLEQELGSTASALAVQVDTAFPLSESWTALAALGYYHYTDVTPDGATALLAENSGNVTVDLDADLIPDRFQSEFRILNPIVSLQCSALDQPLVFSAELIHNFGAKNERDEGWAFGAALGNAREAGDTRIYYQWQVVEQDAVFSPIAQDDFLLATNHRSHLMGCNYQFSEKLGLNLWGLVSMLDDAGGLSSEDSRWRLRLDLNIKF